MEHIWDQDWLNANSQRRYPLFELTTAKDDTGTFVLPDDVLVDLVWSTHINSELDITKFQVLTVSLFADRAIIAFGYDGIPVASLTVVASSHTLNQTYSLIGSSADFFDSNIQVTVGKLDNLLAQPQGNWTFDLEGGRLEPSVVRPDTRGVTSLVLSVRGSDSDRIQDEIELAAGSNIRFTPSVVGGRTRIRIDAIDGAGLNDPCGWGAAVGPPIRTINSVGPDSVGNLRIVGDDCLEVDEIENGIEIKDKCSQPCCGCEELAVLMSTIETLQRELDNMNNVTTRMESSMQNMRDNILVSRLGNAGECGPTPLP